MSASKSVDPDEESLTASQAQALACFRKHARARREAARATIQHVLRMADVAEPAFVAGVEVLRAHGRVVIHFHPDRLARDGELVARALLRDGVYKMRARLGELLGPSLRLPTRGASGAQPTTCCRN